LQGLSTRCRRAGPAGAAAHGPRQAFSDTPLKKLPADISVKNKLIK
jgi:hypothetical protein